jgi:hypothetical protein
VAGDGAVAAIWLGVGFALLGAIVSAIRLTDMPQQKATST